jgi:hypothetical protein
MSQSKPLTQEDQELIDRLIQLISLRTDDLHPIKGAEIVSFFNRKIRDGKLLCSKPLTEQKLRKITNYIRLNGLLPIMSSSKGYYLSTNPIEIMKMVESLESRCIAIQQAADGLRKMAVKFHNSEKKLVKKDTFGIIWD